MLEPSFEPRHAPTRKIDHNKQTTGFGWNRCHKSALRQLMGRREACNSVSRVSHMSQRCTRANVALSS